MPFPSAPICFSIEITLSCNNKCSGCSNISRKAGHQNSALNWDLLLDLISPPRNRKKYAEAFRITGGEPTLHNDFFHIIRYLDSFKIPHALFTTGRWSKTDQIIDLYKNCKHTVGLLISLHGSTEASHTAFIGEIQGSFEETCKNISIASKAGITVHTNTVLTRYSCEQIKDIINLSNQLGAERAVFNRFISYKHSLLPTESQLKRTVDLIENLRNKGIPCRLGNCIPECFIENSSKGSNSGIEHCTVSPNGWVRPDNLTTFTFGNIFEQNIEDIWQSERANYYRHQVPNECHECIELPRCRGGEKSVCIEYGLKKDNLIKSPIKNKKPKPIILDPNYRPVPYFNVREQHFGYILTRYDWSIPFSAEALPIVKSIQNRDKIETIENRFGEEGKEIVGHLFEEGFIG